MTNRVLLNSVITLAFNETEYVANGLIMLRNSKLDIKSTIANKYFNTFENLKKGKDQVILGEIAAKALDKEFDSQFFWA